MLWLNIQEKGIVMEKEWINDSEYYCNTCDTTFKVYALDNEPRVQFCPCCGSRDIEDTENE